MTRNAKGLGEKPAMRVEPAFLHETGYGNGQSMQRWALRAASSSPPTAWRATKAAPSRGLLSGAGLKSKAKYALRSRRVCPKCPT